MKVVYCLINSSGVGGMERSICCKANYLADVAGYDVTIITTDRKGRDHFYEFSPKIRFVDLGINYEELGSMSFFPKLTAQIRKRKLHKERLSNILLRLKPDISISTYTHELSILSEIKDGSKKLVEIHFSKQYKAIEYSHKPKFSFQRIFALMADKRKKRFVKKYDSVVVLTKADKQQWGNIPHMEVIPNVVSFYPENTASDQHKQVVSVGRLTYVKGYHLLIEAWESVFVKHPDWRLSIFGDGEDNIKLRKAIERRGLNDSIFILPCSQNIENEYLNSSIYVMSSLVEGFGVVLAEAMACGLPCISFDCPNGPAEVITHGEDGLLVQYKNTEKLAEAILFLIEDKILRKEMGENARENVRRFLPERIMPRWISLFEQITGTSEY